MYEGNRFRHLRVNSLFCINSGRFFKTSNVTTFHPILQVDHSCRLYLSYTEKLPLTPENSFDRNNRKRRPDL